MKLIDEGWQVHLTYHDRFTGEDVTRTFCVHGSGGYVREHNWAPGGVLDGQVCERLSSSGHTLWATPASLAQVIRHEYKRMRARGNQAT